jgi:hypothetical protein
MTDPHIHEYDYDDGNKTDYATIYANVDGQDIPFDERFMKLDDVLSTDYQVTDKELADYNAAETSDTGLPLNLEGLKDFAARREAEEEYVKQEIARQGQLEGFDSQEATRRFKVYKLNYVTDIIRKMMALYEAHRLYLYSISKGRQPPVGTENEDVRYYIKFLYLHRRGIKNMQRELRRREEELRTGDFH